MIVHHKEYLGNKLKVRDTKYRRPTHARGWRRNSRAKYNIRSHTYMAHSGSAEGPRGGWSAATAGTDNATINRGHYGQMCADAYEKP